MTFLRVKYRQLSCPTTEEINCMHKIFSIIKILSKKIIIHTDCPHGKIWMDRTLSLSLCGTLTSKIYKWIKCVMEDWKVDHKNIYWVACIVIHFLRMKSHCMSWGRWKRHGCGLFCIVQQQKKVKIRKQKQ